jgi:hypothetical protein
METIPYTLVGVITPTDLVKIIQAEPTLVSIFDSLDTNFDGTNTFLQVVFTQILSEGQQTTLDGLVASFGATNPLKTAKATRMAALQMDVQGYLENHYSFLLRNQLFNLYVLAKFDSLTNRAAYLRPGINWINSIAIYSASVAATIQAQTTVTDVQNVTWNISGNTSADPGITLAGALAINS